jgi:hypothetical protein
MFYQDHSSSRVKGLRALWHYASVKVILCVPLLFASYAVADEASDRVAIDRTIAALNELPRRAALFTHDADASSELARLPRVTLLWFPAPELASDPARADSPTVTISKDPWGEVTINFPWMVSLPPGMRNFPDMVSLPLAEIPNSRIVSGSIRFITPDVALADGDWTYKDGPTTQTIPLLFVMKREGDTWKIAALRVLAPR